MPDTTDTMTTKPDTGEQSRKQNSGRVGSMSGHLPGFATPPAGLFGTYRRMRSNPTIALARFVATAPVRSADWSFEVEDGVPDERLEFVKTAIDPLRSRLVRDMLFALDYGFQAFEKVWTVRDGRLVYERIKPLAPDSDATGSRTEIMVDEHGQFAGIRQGKVMLDAKAQKVMLFTHDEEAGDLYGRSRHENVREKAWWPWDQTMERTGKYVTKVSGAIPIVRYPEGDGKNVDGSAKSNFDLAKELLAALGKLHGVAMPKALAPWAEDLARGGFSIDDLSAWSIDFLESKGQHGGDLTDLMRYFDSLMMRGWLVPERAAIEGQQGTKAEAAVHGDIVLAGGELLLEDVQGVINRQVVDPLLVVNFGEQARGTVKMMPAPLIDEKAALIRRMVEKVLGEPGNLDLLLEVADLDSMLDQTAIPKLDETIDNEKVRENVRKAKAAGAALAPQFPAFGQPPRDESLSDEIAASFREVMRGIERDAA